LAARLAGALDARQEKIGPMSTHLDAQASVSEYQSPVARLRAAMLSAVFSAEWEVGRGLTAEQSIVLMSIGTVSYRSRCCGLRIG